MDYFLEFHWWYILIAFLCLFLFFGKGGIVIKRYIAEFEILDDRFNACVTEADYSIFKEGTPDKIDIDIENLPVPAGDELEFQINGKALSVVKVKKNKEAEFEHWSDEDVDFPQIQEDDELLIKYQNADVIKGIFRLKK